MKTFLTYGALSIAALCASPVAAYDVVGVAADMPADSSRIAYGASMINVMGRGDFAPYYMTANRHGLITQSADVMLLAAVQKPLDLEKRFSWGAAAEVAAAWTEQTTYQRYDDATASWTEHDRNGRRLLLQQLYAEVKYRSVYLTGGIKQHKSKLLTEGLTSGDLTESANASAMPEVRAGFVDFQDIPFTNGWVQINGEISYGWFTDGGWWRNHFNYYDGHLTSGSVRSYRYLYLRTKPSKPFSVTVGAQCATIFGGTRRRYVDGALYTTSTYDKNLKDYIEAFLPVSDKEDFRLGNTLGSWDLSARYLLHNGTQLRAYFQWPWEDGSGIGRRNGFDGLWGVEYTAPAKGWVDGAVVEYLDFTNQSGPLHWAPADSPGTTITGSCTGGDDYYNNAYYNSYAFYGMAMGSPMFRSPVFNTDGNPQFQATRMRGVHVSVCGSPFARLSYRAMLGYRRAWGNGYISFPSPLHATSAMLEASYAIASLRGLNIRIALAMDHGNLTGNNSGVEFTVCYTGNFSLRK